MGINTENLKDITGVEIMHRTLLWCYNWREEDFKIAFKNSPLGWDYQWDKLQGKLRKDEDSEVGANPCQAIMEVILNMDEKHENMLFDFLFNVRYPKDIEAARRGKLQLKEWESFMKAKESENHGK